MADKTAVSLRLLGRFEIATDRAASVGLLASGRRGRALMAYLALQPDFTETRERLATLLWGDRLDRQARQSLRQCLASLRKDCKAIGLEFLRIDQETVGFDPASLNVDAGALPMLAQSAEPRDVDAAIGLYRGEFLDGLRLDSEGFDAWAAVERERLRGFAALALEKSAQMSDRIGDKPGAIAAAERLAALDPLNEAAQRMLLAILARNGSREIALARAVALTRLIRQGLDTDPEPATLAMIEAIRRGELAETPAAEAGSPIEQATPAPDAPTAAISSGIAESLRAATTVSRRRSLPLGLGAAAFVIVGVTALAITLLFSGRDHPAPTAKRVGPTSSTSWQPPGILADTGVDPVMRAANGISAVIVLPFAAVANSDGGGANRRLADLITDDLIGDLSHLPQIRVIARQTSHFYGGRPVDIGAVGTELGVRYVVDGRVQLQGQTLRIEASLVDTASRLEVWSQRFERDYDDRLAAQDELINAIARALQLGVINVEDRRRPPAQRDAKIDDLLAHGWAAMANLASLGTISGADGYFDGVLQRDPDNVSALIGLGGYHASVVAMFLVPDPDEHLQRADALLQKAIEKSPSSVMAYYYLGLVHKARGQQQQALKDFTKVVQENPSLPLGYAQIGHLVSRMGRPDEAMEYIRYAVRLNPKDPNMGLVGMMAGEIELERGNDAAALDWFKRSLGLAPINPFVHAATGAALVLTGDTAEAARQAEEVRRLAPRLTLDRMIARLVATSQPGHEPARLIDGLRREFAATP